MLFHLCIARDSFFLGIINRHRPATPIVHQTILHAIPAQQCKNANSCSLLHLGDFRLSFMFRVAILRSTFLTFRRVLCHDILEMAPQGLDWRKLVSD